MINHEMPCWYKLAAAISITAALFTFVAGLLGWWFGYGLELIELYGTIHIGYGPTFWGSIVGAIWVFIETFIFVIIAGWLYCAFCGKCEKNCSTSSTSSGSNPGNPSNPSSHNPSGMGGHSDSQ